MATPDINRVPNEAEWSIQPDYVIPDNDGRMVCGVTGQPKRRGEFVYRGAFIDEFVGFFTIGQDSAEQLAKLIGYVDPDVIDDVVAQAVNDKNRIEELEQQIAGLELVVEAYVAIDDFHQTNFDGNEEAAE